MTPQTALKYDVEVQEAGRVELAVPFPAGTHIIVFIVSEEDETFKELLSAAESSTDFWNNPWDD